jgi:hypothetical protein
MGSRLQSILDIVDEGLRVYRRGFSGFVVITALWLVPIAIGIGGSIAAAQYWGDTATFLITLVWMVLALPLALLLSGGISRATLVVQAEQAIELRKMLAVPPVRLMGMGCYSLVFYLVANVVTSAFSMFCLCPLYMGVAFLLGSVGVGLGESQIGEGVMLLLGMVLGILLMLIYGLALAMSGATFSSLIYAVQPFVHQDLRFRAAVEHSVNLVFYRFGFNLLAFLLCSIIFAAMAIAVSVAIGVLLPLPLLWALGRDSAIAQGSSAIAWLLGFLVVIPPMPIWMALLYQRNFALREGNVLEARIAEQLG